MSWSAFIIWTPIPNIALDGAQSTRFAGVNKKRLFDDPNYKQLNQITRLLHIETVVSVQGYRSLAS